MTKEAQAIQKITEGVNTLKELGALPDSNRAFLWRDGVYYIKVVKEDAAPLDRYAPSGWY